MYLPVLITFNFDSKQIAASKQIADSNDFLRVNIREEKQTLDNTQKLIVIHLQITPKYFKIVLFGFARFS
jgi:hypothetical protein